MLSTSIADTPLSYIILTSLLLYIVGLGIYRLYFSPIAGIPGPKLAALTQWYETYYEMGTNPSGQFMFHYRKLHEKYGPIVRISPLEVHIQDSQFYHVFFSKPWDKPKYLQHRFGNDNGLTPTPGHQLHKHRRAALNPFFSKRQILDFSPAIQDQASRVCDRLNREYRGTDKVLRLDWMFASYVADIIVSYCFENKYNWLDTSDFRCEFAEAMNSLLEGVHLVTQFPWIARILNSLPKDLVAKLNPDVETVNNFNKEMHKQIKWTLENQSSYTKGSGRKTVFSALLESDLPPQELSPVRLQQEALTVIGAGVETTRWSLTIGSFHIINNPEILSKLQAELEEAIPDPQAMPSLEQLEQLPYLDACIQETCRLSYGTSQRGHRISDSITLQYGSYSIPPGTTVSMDNYAVSHDETIFPDSHSFKPERWLSGETAPDGKRLNTYMVSFGRGSRQCVGQNMALAEMYIMMANLFRKFEFDLYQTDRSAVDCVRDAFAPRPKPGTLGVRVYVK